MNRPNRAHILQVGDTWICGINKYRVSAEDIDGEGTTRDETGTMHRDVLRKRVKKLAVSCIQDSTEILETAKLLQDDIIEMNCFCPADPNAVDYLSKGKFYVSKVEFDITFFDNENPEDSIWSVAFNAIEV